MPFEPLNRTSAAQKESVPILHVTGPEADLINDALKIQGVRVDPRRIQVLPGGTVRAFGEQGRWRPVDVAAALTNYAKLRPEVAAEADEASRAIEATSGAVLCCERHFVSFFTRFIAHGVVAADGGRLRLLVITDDALHLSSKSEVGVDVVRCPPGSTEGGSYHRAIVTDPAWREEALHRVRLSVAAPASALEVADAWMQSNRLDLLEAMHHRIVDTELHEATENLLSALSRFDNELELAQRRDPTPITFEPLLGGDHG